MNQTMKNKNDIQKGHLKPKKTRWINPDTILINKPKINKQLTLW